MRSILVRCLVALLAFALVSGNANAHLYPTSAEQPATHAHQHHHGVTGQSHRQQPDSGKGVECCCDCLWCVSAFNLAPGLAIVGPALFGTTLRFAGQTAALNGRVLVPDPEPPRAILPS